MSNKILIDDDFIEKWQKEYDKKENDEAEYNAILVKVSYELTKGDTISEETFLKILNWKAPRVKGIIKRDNFAYYANGIRQAIKSPENKKIEILDELYGIGLPVASTILQFIFPKIFPIVDFRTVEVLQNFEKLDKLKKYYYYRDSIEGYFLFCEAIKSIAEEHPKYNLRQIDKALFAYNKYELKPKMNCGFERCDVNDKRNR